MYRCYNFTLLNKVLKRIRKLVLKLKSLWDKFSEKKKDLFLQFNVRSRHICSIKKE